jgi:hypothetical protein
MAYEPDYDDTISVYIGGGISALMVMIFVAYLVSLFNTLQAAFLSDYSLEAF